jgi:LmbE family N-acetylglucosaminyl deacetylase
MSITLTSSIVALLAHPDDIKSVTGVALRAMSGGSSFALILVTKGEGLNSAARKGVPPLEMGRLRVEELRHYLSQIGVPEQNLYILGVPDGSQTLPALRDDFWRVEGEPFVDPLLHVDRVPYDDAYRPGMPFHGETLLETLQGLLAGLQPQTVLTHHPRDGHADHRAVAFFARRVCRGLYRQGLVDRMPALYATLVYCQTVPWPPAGDSFYVDEIVAWYPRFKAHVFPLTAEELALKKRASMVFTPTLSVEYIQSNMKNDELLWRL